MLLVVNKPKRKRITPYQLTVLSDLFASTDTPNYQLRENTASKLNMTNREVQVFIYTCECHNATSLMKLTIGLVPKSSCQSQPQPITRAKEAWSICISHLLDPATRSPPPASSSANTNTTAFSTASLSTTIPASPSSWCCRTHCLSNRTTAKTTSRSIRSGCESKTHEPATKSKL